MSASMYMGSLLAAADAIGKDCMDVNLAFILVRACYPRLLACTATHIRGLGVFTVR